MGDRKQSIYGFAARIDRFYAGRGRARGRERRPGALLAGDFAWPERPNADLVSLRDNRRSHPAILDFVNWFAQRDFGSGSPYPFDLVYAESEHLRAPIEHPPIERAPIEHPPIERLPIELPRRSSDEIARVLIISDDGELPDELSHGFAAPKTPCETPSLRRVSSIGRCANAHLVRSASAISRSSPAGARPSRCSNSRWPAFDSLRRRGARPLRYARGTRHFRGAAAHPRPLRLARARGGAPRPRPRAPRPLAGAPFGARQRAALHRHLVSGRRRRSSLPEDERARLQRFATRFAELQKTALGLAPADIIRYAIEKLELDQVLAALPHAAQRFGNLGRLTALASREGGSLASFVRWLERQIDDESDESEAAVLSPGDDAVTLMTIHGSKGLEFPAVSWWTWGQRPARNPCHWPSTRRAEPPRPASSCVTRERAEGRFHPRMGRLLARGHGARGGRTTAPDLRGDDPRQRAPLSLGLEASPNGSACATLKTLLPELADPAGFAAVESATRYLLRPAPGDASPRSRAVGFTIVGFAGASGAR